MHLSGASLSETREVELDNTHYDMEWVQRLKVDGSLYGKSYIPIYEYGIEEFFQKGKHNLSDKMNPAQMRDVLIAKYPNSFTITS